MTRHDPSVSSPSSPTFRLPTAAATQLLGSQLADLLRPGDLVILSGPLGAGKTAFTQGIGAGLQVQGRVVSPTFVIARSHRGGRIPLVHVDAYRLQTLADVEDLDLDVTTEEAVTVVEWGAGLVEQLAEAHLAVSIDRDGESEVRTITMTGHGGDWIARLQQVRGLRS